MATAEETIQTSEQSKIEKILQDKIEALDKEISSKTKERDALVNYLENYKNHKETIDSIFNLLPKEETTSAPVVEKKKRGRKPKATTEA